MIKWLCILALLSIWANPGLSLQHSGHGYQVLIVHSYSQEYPWTKSQHEGFVKTLTNQTSVPIKYSTEYLDTKRRSYDAEYGNQYSQYMQQKYLGYLPDIIYVSDDNGYLFARDHLLKLYPDTPILFSGVNDLSVIEEIRHLPIRGVFEKTEISKNIDLVIDIEKRDIDVIILGDSSYTHFAIEAEINQELLNYVNVQAEFVVHDQIKDLIEHLSKLKQKYLFLTTIGGIKSDDGFLLSPEEVIGHITKAGDFAIFTMEDDYLLDGVLGGYVTNGQSQGSSAAELALGLRGDTKIADIKNVVGIPNTYVFDQSRLVELNLTLPDHIIDSANFYNRPISFYSKYRSLILSVLMFLSVAAIILFGFIIFSRINKRRKENSLAMRRMGQVERYQNAIIAWSAVSHENVAEAFRLATEISAKTLKVKRVSIWLYNETKSSIQCRDMYIDGEGHSSGGKLFKSDLPCYFSAVETGRRLVINDARTDQATNELTESYLIPNSIYSMLDVPIFYSGEIIGVVCHEQVGSPREWSANEQGFSSIIAGDISLSIEIEKRKQIEKNLAHQAYHDSLTGLPNRYFLLDRIDRATRQSKRKTTSFAILFLDIDNFKQINDSFGHTAGDAFIISIAERLKKIIREPDTIGRLGGNVFTILLNEFETVAEIEKIASKLFEAIREPFLVNRNKVFVTTSIGISIFPEHGATPDILLRNADSAMHRAKETSQNSFEFYTEDITENAIKKVVMIESMNTALEKNEFEVYYQPQYNVGKKQISGLEALIRWNHPEFGFLTPNLFLPVAEESGLMVDIDRWMMRKALKQMKQWETEGLILGRLSLNLNMQQMEQPDFLEFLSNLLKDSRCKGETIGLEVTEGQLMKNPSRTIDILNEISKRGIKISIDDFGTGYSSLAYLKKLPVDVLKIDREFIQGLPTDANDTSITKAIITLARSLSMEVLAEGVENEEQLNFLQTEGCNLIQGYYLSRPKSAADIPALIRYPLT